MAAELKFYAGEDFTVYDASSSGLGFFAGGFGESVPVGDYNSRTFITNSNGTVEGPEVDNIKYSSPGSAILGQSGSPIALTAIPNYKATLNARFTFDSGVRTQNVEARIFDRTDVNAGATGVTTKVAEIIHSGITQTDNGSGDTTWITPAGSAVVVDLVSSPGTSGLSPSGIDTVDTRHDWYLAISASPDSIGSKTQFGLYISLEYL